MTHNKNIFHVICCFIVFSKKLQWNKFQTKDLFMIDFSSLKNALKLEKNSIRVHMQKTFFFIHFFQIS